jgi:peptidoglycan/xylan/chitin deacetylase (PgdA/CDA1 family)
MNFVTTYKALKKYKGTSLLSEARETALDILGLLQKLKGDNAFKKNRIQFLCLHHVFNDEQKNLRDLLDFLLKDHSFISYSEALKKILDNKIDKPYICISSDDGFKNNLNALNILNEYGISACFFICPDIIENQNEENIEIFCSEKLHIPPVEFLNWNDVDRLLKDGHEIGSHTMKHINLAASEPDIIADDLQLSYDIIKKYVGDRVHFAFPYGRYFHFTAKAREVVFNTGYYSCSSAERGCHVQQSEPPVCEKLLVRRDNIVLAWKPSHIKYFLRRNAMHAKFQQNNFLYN